MTTDVRAPVSPDEIVASEPVRQTLPYTEVLGVPVSALWMERALEELDRWFAERRGGYVIIRDVHGVMRAQSDLELLRIHRRADMITPDGMPLVWVSRQRGRSEVGRVCGPDLLPAVCERTQGRGIRHYFYGGAEGVPERLAAKLRERFPELTIVGTESPPFRPLTEAEDDATVARIRAADPHVVWVGLSTPKQEQWMAAHASRLPNVVLIGIGAAFDFHVGSVKRAPVWMQRTGTEWLFRLVSEPRRLWRRYLVLGPRFVLRVTLESWQNRKLSPSTPPS